MKGWRGGGGGGVCVHLCVRVNVRLDEAAYIIAIHNQYFYFVSEEEEESKY